MASDWRSPPDMPPTSRSPSSMRVMPKSCTDFTAMSFALTRSKTWKGPHFFVGSLPMKKQRPTLISGKVPPNW